MAVVHLMLQGKGGVGKSFITSILYQYLKAHNVPVFAYDTDPINATFAGYKEFDVTLLEIMNGDDIDHRRFDLLIESICALELAGSPFGDSVDSINKQEIHAVVDNGSSCFPPLCAYLKENDALEILKNEGHEVILHSVVTGGQALADTLSGLKSLTVHFENIPIVVWLNPFFGEITIDGSDFYEFKVYAESSANFRAVIKLPTLKQSTFGKDLEELLAKRWSFEAAIKSSLPLMTRSRLVSTWRAIDDAISQAYLI